MAVRIARKWCRYCKRDTRHEQSYFSFGAGCIVTLVTGFLFLPFWILLKFLDGFKKWHCDECGTTYRWTLFRGSADGGDDGTAAAGRGRVANPDPKGPAYVPASGPKPAGAGVPWGRMAGGVLAFGKSLPDRVAAGKSSVIETYRSLPEWGHPIVWGLGIAAPIVSMMVVARAIL